MAQEMWSPSFKLWPHEGQPPQYPSLPSPVAFELSPSDEKSERDERGKGLLACATLSFQVRCPLRTRLLWLHRLDSAGPPSSRAADSSGAVTSCGLFFFLVELDTK